MHEQKIGKRPIVRNKTGKPKLSVKTAFGKPQGGFQKSAGKKVSAK